MSALVKKEIRLLLPAWTLAMVLAIIPGVLFIIWVQIDRENAFALYDSLPGFFVQFLFVVGVLFLGITSFGQEFNSGSFTIFLSQPMDRRRIWFVKIATLAIAFVSVWLTATLLTSWQFHVLESSFWAHSSAFSGSLGFGAASLRSATESLRFGVLEFLALSTLVTFSGGLWTTLLLRQTTGAFWFTLLTPLAIILGINLVLQEWLTEGKSINTVIVTALILYSLAGFALAWRLFLRAQDLQSSGVEMSLPGRRIISETKTASVSARPRHWLTALVWKEIQLHQSSLVIAALLLVLHLASFFIRKFHGHVQNPDLQFVLEAIWILWLLMPLLIGATAIAEERRLGVAEAQLCLPVAPRTQLFFKFCVALVLSLLFGGLIPRLLEGTQTDYLWFWFFLIPAGTFLVSFYASSLSRTTLQAIGLAMVVGLMIYCSQVYIGYWQSDSPSGPYYRNFLSHFELFGLYFTLSIFSLVLGCVTFWNFKRPHPNSGLWIYNIFIILATLVFSSLLALAIYFH